MKTPLFIFFLAAAALLAAATVRADLGHSWNSGSELPAAVDSALSSSDSSSEPASGDSSDTSATPSPSLDTQIADLLDDESLAPSSSSLDLSTLTVPLSEEEVLLDRLAVEAAAEVAADAESPYTPDTSAPIGVSDTAFATGTDRIATRVSSAMAVQGVSPAGTAPSVPFAASDKAENYGGNWNLGDNCGTGFGKWRQVASADLPSRSISDQGFAIYAQSGVGVEAIGRSFADDIALESGTFKVSATHDSSEHFSGFALYSDGDREILRWGLTTAEDTEAGGGNATGFWYFRNGQSTLIHTIEAGGPVSADYSISWTLLSSGMSVKLSIASDAYTDTLHLSLDNSSAVTAIAALVAGSAQSETLHFDNLEVSGRAVPEPATILLLSLGTFLLATRRRR